MTDIATSMAHEQIKELRLALDTAIKERNEYWKENERLRGLLAEWENHAGPYKDAENERLREENDKLRLGIDWLRVRAQEPKP